MVLDVAPVADEKVPATHLLHDTVPVSEAYVPATHLLQVAELVAPVAVE